jgi:LPXTG-motif cell wall-anchored protein
MSADRRFLPLLATAALMLPAGPAWAQSGAGDDQYTDPFAGEQNRGQQARPRQAAQQPPGEDEPGLSEQPPVTPPPTTTTPSEPAEPAPAPAAEELPNTGYEIPAIALLGLGLLVSGIGLRLRTVDDTLF